MMRLRATAANMFVFLVLLAPTVQAAGDVTAKAGTQTDPRKTITERLRQAEENSKTREALLRVGEESASFCAHCHGKDGNSVMPLVPNLAGQNPVYLLDQFEKFADGRRQDYIMSSLARQISLDDKIAIVIYYASKPVHPATADSALVKKGGEHFRQRCVACHGADARGGETYARLAGQRAEYMKHRLYNIQTQTGVVASAMTGIAKTLTDADIEALTAYLSSLP